MAEHVIAHLPVRVVGRPFALVGYSGGAAVAHEVARRLHRRGVTVGVVLVDPAVGMDPSATSARRTWRDAPRLAAALWTQTRLELATVVGRIHVEPARYRWFHRVHSAAVRRHRLEAIEVPTTVVLARRSLPARRTTTFSSATTEVVVDGDHHSVLQSPHVAGVAAVVREVAGSVRSSC